MVPRVGQRIGPYEILGRLGSGGMGLVYSAWDSRLQRDVAIKILREEFTSPGMRKRFLQEARAASRLNQANICTIFDIGEQEGDPYLVMELLKGETVRSVISRGPISVEDIVTVATEVSDALIVAHARGIIHRDIKPANIMLVDKPAGRFQTKVLDFGLAKLERDGVDSRIDLTSAGTTVGTVAYMSPEQARGEALDARSDLFSLGTVLYEMATGELPFQGATSALVFVQLLSETPESLRQFNPEIPKDLEKIILKLLEKRRSDRFQT
ncbi:MAG: serine/threonine-protein kinase, partial [Bryocella sp.]